MCRFWKKQESPKIIETSQKSKKISPIYYITAPFGIIFKHTSGRGSSDVKYGFGFSVDTTLEEKFVIKYMDGNRLRTATENAEDANVVIDGTFCYEQMFETFYENGKEGSTYPRGTIIHLPKLPIIKDKLTKSFTFF